MFHPRFLLLAAAILSIFTVLPTARAQTSSPISLTLSNTTTAYTQDFNTLATTGTSSTTPAGWGLSESGTNADTSYTAGTGSGTTGDTYSFGSTSSTDRAFGTLQSGTNIPSIGAAFTNNTGLDIVDVSISYRGEEWRLGTISRTDQLDFQYSTNATSLITGTWTDINALDFVTPNTVTAGAKDGNASGNFTNLNSTISNLGSATGVTNGSTFYVRWTDFNASGADDGLAVDDFSVTVTKLATNGTDRTVTTLPGLATTVIQNGSNATASTLTVNNSTTQTFAGVLQNGGTQALALTKSGAGTLTLGGANTYTGLTTITEGTLNATNNSSLGSSTAATAGLLMNPSSGTATVNFTSAAPAIASLASSGAGTSNVVLGNTTTPAATTLTVGGNNTSTTFAGVISDLSGTNAAATGTVDKIGTGTLTLSGANTYTGSTGVTAGTLLVTNTTGSGTGTGSVTVNNSGTTLAGGTTNGAGGISGPVNINPSANLSPGTSGNGAGTTAILNTGALTLVTASNFNVDLNGTTAGTGYDRLNVTGTVNVSGSNLAVTVGGALTLGDKFFITLNDGTDLVSGTFAQGVTVTANNGYTFLIDYLDNGDAGTLGNDISLTLTAIPEPSTWIGAALALAAIGFTQRKRFGKRFRVLG